MAGGGDWVGGVGGDSGAVREGAWRREMVMLGVEPCVGMTAFIRIVTL